MSTSGSRNRGSSLEGEDSEVELMGSSVLHSPQQGFTGEGWWRMVAAYSMVAIGKHASLLLHLAQVEMSVDLVGSRVLPVVKIQVDVEEFQHNSPDGAVSRVQGFKDEVPTQK